MERIKIIYVWGILFGFLSLPVYANPNINFPLAIRMAEARIARFVETPEGKLWSFTPVAETDKIEFVNASNEDVMAVGDEILKKHLAAFKALAK